MVEEIVYKKLIERKRDKMQKQPETPETRIKQGASVCAEVSGGINVEECFDDLNRFIRAMEHTRQNFAFRHIYSCRKVIGKVIVFGKRVVRKLLKWYIEPICFQQTDFNNSVTPSIGRLTELARELINRSEQQRRIEIETTQRIEQVEESHRLQQDATANSMAKVTQRIEQVEESHRLQQDATANSMAKVTQRIERVEESYRLQQDATASSVAAVAQEINRMKEWQEEKVFTGQQMLKDTFAYTDEKISELHSSLIATEVSNRMLTQQVGALSKELEELRIMMDLKSTAIQDLEANMDCLREADPTIFKGIQRSFFDKHTTSQSGEDSIVAYITMVLGYKPENVTYLDLGANHAKELSNTYYFYQQGAQGVLVEANPDLISELKFKRNRDVVLNNCVTDTDGDTIDFFVVNGDGISSRSKKAVDEALSVNSSLEVTKTVRVETLSVNSLMERYFGGAPILLNIDIEGSDMEVLNSMDFDRFRPLVIVAETIPYSTKLVVGQKNVEVVDFLKRKNYVEYAFTGINSIFIDKEQIEGRASM